MAQRSVVRESTSAGADPNTLPAQEAQPELRERGTQIAKTWKTIPHPQKTTGLRQRFEDAVAVLAGLQHAIKRNSYDDLSEDLKWLSDHLRIFATDIMDLRVSMRKLQKLPHVRVGTAEPMPRSWVLMRGLMETCRYELSESALMAYVEGASEVDPLEYKELWALGQMLIVVLFEEAAKRGRAAYESFARGVKASGASVRMDQVIKSLRLVSEINWEELVEPLSPVNRIFMEDPAGVYPRMDEITRGLYLTEISDLSKGSHATEAEIARHAIKMCLEEKPVGVHDPHSIRYRHVGYYLIGPGARVFRDRIGYRPSFDAWLQDLLRRFPDEFYILLIEFIALITIAGIILPFTHGRQPLSMLFLMAILLFLPVTQAAVELVNYFITSILKPKPLPKLDFSEGVPDDCKTLVTIPTLLINEKQIRQLVEDLEIRYLGNQDKNIHYALLTDLPDSPEAAEEHDPRIELATSLINDLNRRYAHLGLGQFYLFHRHRVYNPQERTWMGWERKRGKLLDLNKLLRNAYDPFPVKIGDMTALANTRFVITLDSDTQLPRGSAARMIGAMAHPLNNPVIDPKRNIVTEGYGILQPRVGISVQSAGRSRLAALYSGQTGFDIYTRAISDVYQDLYGEGIFTGKGIYDVDALRRVLESRFPKNTLLSHDLIEGAYARAGLLSDVEVIDDYPSHYSAYNRRKHRWLRGDWQIARWLFGWVPDEAGRLVKNPISLISRWKIFDNLRRSTVEPAVFVLLVSGWLFLPGGPMTWTCVVAGLLFLPGLFQFVFGLFRFARLRELNVLRDAASNLITSIETVILNLTFLAHQAMVALDAIIRTVVRSNITKRSLLEWETATEAELGIRKRTPVDIYLDWMPAVAIALGLIVALLRPKALPHAIPVLLLWACSKLISNWLNRPPLVQVYQVSANRRRLARNTFLKTWRFFAEFSNEQNNWLIPDNVQEEPRLIAERTSTTNLGFLLNSRQAACELGSLTVVELADLTAKTFATMLRMPRKHGHFLNWYDNFTLQPLEPQFISTVDNGNLVASLLSLKQGLFDQLNQPILRTVAHDDIFTKLKLLESMGVVRRKEISDFVKLMDDGDAWVTRALRLPEIWPLIGKKSREASEEAAWWIGEVRRRIQAIRQLTEDFAPWLQPGYEPLCKIPKLELQTALSKLCPGDAVLFYQRLEERLDQALREETGETAELMLRLRERIPECRRNAEELKARIIDLVKAADSFALDMDFSLLFDPRRKLLSIGYNVAAERNESACYDLMASEARIAAFVAVAKSEVPQECWFRLGRTQTVWEGETVLASWTGTMFEYLMPALWMRLYANTLLDRSAHSAVRMQQMYAAQFHVPWGISESAWSEQSPEGHYQYRAFGVPTVALKNPTEAARLVISPYSCWLALMVDPEAALLNAEKMARLGWTSPYGYYEAADYGERPRKWALFRKPVIVRSWMAHHQGMTLLALVNWLGNDEPFVRWFHTDRRVQATELLLQEKPLRVKPLPSVRPDLGRLARVHRWKAAV